MSRRHERGCGDGGLLSVEDNTATLNSIMMNLQPSTEKDDSYEMSKIADFDSKYNELKENLQKPNELKEYEDFDLKCIETSFHQQQTELRRKSSNKRNKDAIVALDSNTANMVAAAAVAATATHSSTAISQTPLQLKRANIEADIQPCGPNEQ